MIQLAYVCNIQTLAYYICQICNLPEEDGVMEKKNRAGEGKVGEEDLRIILLRTVTECSGEVDIWIKT